MFFAIDENGNRVNAEEGEFTNCVCPACGCPVIQKRGDTNSHHFAHDHRKGDKTLCTYDDNSNDGNMSKWHRRMQGYFSDEQQEYVFTDEDTGEKHIADVYIKEKNTVLEFQYSSISEKEFLSRTNFHIKEGRRIAWLFYEGKAEDEEPDYSNVGKYIKFKKAKQRQANSLYMFRTYQWLHIRKPVKAGPYIYQRDYRICVYTGAEKDVAHRIIFIDLEKNIVVFSLHDIFITDSLDVDDFSILMIIGLNTVKLINHLTVLKA